MNLDGISGCFFGSSLTSNHYSHRLKPSDSVVTWWGVLKAASREWNSLGAACPAS